MMGKILRHGLVVLAGGSGTRMGAGINKQLLTLGEQTVTEIALRQLIAHGTWEQIVLVAAQKDWEALAHIAQKVSSDLGVGIHQVAGGKERQDSVNAGVTALGLEIDTVWIHDGARPFVEADLCQRLAAALEVAEAVIPVLPSKDTLKRVHHHLVTETIDRSEIYRIQTPQCFHRRRVADMQALAATRGGFTDDASIAEALGIAVATVAGSEWNIKLTTPEDLVIGEAIYRHLKGAGKCV